MELINALSSPETQINGNFQTLEWAQVYGRRAQVTTGLTWGYYGGVMWGGIMVADGTLTLTDAAANYIVVNKTTGAISVSTAATNWDDTAAYARVYKVTTAAGVVSAVEDHRAGEFGIISGGEGTPGPVGPTGPAGPEGPPGTDGGAGAIAVEDTIPTLAQGEQWFESDSGGLFMRYVNPDATETLIAMHPVAASLRFAPPPPPPSPLLTDLISYWKLDEPSGNALDVHGTNHLTDTNAVGTAAGKVGTARDFERDSSQYFTTASNASLQIGTSAFTFAAWVKLESLVQTWFIGKDDASSNREYALIYDGGFAVFITTNGTNGGMVFLPSTMGTPSLGVWYFVVFGRETSPGPNRIFLQVNNGTENTAGMAGNVFSGSAPFRIGACGAAPLNTHDGLLDEIGFWKRVLTSDERTELYNSGNGKTYPFT